MNREPTTSPRRNREKIVAILWLLAGIMAFTAMAIDWMQEHRVRWVTFVFGFFSLLLALMTFLRARRR